MENEAKTSGESGGIGAIAGVIIIIILLIAGGWYFIGNRVEKMQGPESTTQNKITTGSSTETADIQADLNNVNLKVLDQP